MWQVEQGMRAVQDVITLPNLGYPQVHLKAQWGEVDDKCCMSEGEGMPLDLATPCKGKGSHEGRMQRFSSGGVPYNPVGNSRKLE